MAIASPANPGLQAATHTPKVSVLLPVYNCATYLRHSITSILDQHFTDFELIVINDGSSDDSAKIIDEFSDPRLRVYHQTNQGLPKTLNRAISLSLGVYLARQDADDISLPTRLEKQVAFLDSHPKVALLGTWTQIIAEDKLTLRQHTHPCSNAELQMRLLFNNVFVHSSVMLRAKALDQIGFYSEEPTKYPPEDYDLWLRIAAEFELANLPEALLHYREIPTSISRTQDSLIGERAKEMSTAAIQGLLQRFDCGPYSENTLAHLVLAMNRDTKPFSFTLYRHLCQLLLRIQMAKTRHFPAAVADLEGVTQACLKELRKTFVKNQLRSHLPFLPWQGLRNLRLGSRL